MKKQGNRIFLFFLALLMIIGLAGKATSVSAETGSSTPVIETADDTSDDTETQAFTQTEENIQTVAEPTSKCYISSARIKEKVDGTGPFDSDDDDGDDSNAKNDIVRSFDSIYYTLEYVTAINTDDPIDRTNLMIEVTLPVDKAVAHFNMDAMKWMQNPQQTEENGVQKLTGYRVLDKGMIPGVGTLSVGIDVKGAANGAEIKPEIKLSLEGNSTEESQTVTDSTTVSATPRYNVVLLKNSMCNAYRYFDLSNGTMSRNNTGDLIKGRLLGYEIGLQLYNTSITKDLKGIELPQGDITFDIKTTQTFNNIDMKDNPLNSTYLWDYSENRSTTETGYLNRTMKLKEDSWIKSAFPWGMPGNEGGGSQKCYNGGNISIIEDSNQKYIYHVKIKNYKFDTEEWEFPEDGLNNTPRKQFTNNIGFFSVDYIQFLVTFSNDVDEIKNNKFTAEVNNFSATSISGKLTNNEQNKNDNASSFIVYSYPIGNISTAHHILTEQGNGKATPAGSPNAAAYLGETLILNTEGEYNGDGYIKKFHHLQKFDSNIFDVQSSSISIYNMALSSFTYKQILYAAKPDKTGWKDNGEMMLASG